MNDYTLMRKMHSALERAESILTQPRTWFTQDHAFDEISWTVREIKDVLREAEGR